VQPGRVGRRRERKRRPARGESLARQGSDLATAVLLLDRQHLVYPTQPPKTSSSSRCDIIGHAPARVFAPSAGLDAAIDKAVAASATEQELEHRRSSAAPSPCTVSPIDDEAALLLEFRRIDQQLKIARNACSNGSRRTAS
jgi:hypothetical protein